MKSTGVSELDTKLDGGYTDGSIVLIETDAVSQGELLLRSFLETHPTLYITTTITGTHVRDIYDTPEDMFVTEVTENASVQNANALISKTDETYANTLISTIDVFETNDRSVYRKFLQQFKEYVMKNNGVCILHTTTNHSPQQRQLTYTIADTIVKVTRETNSDEAETYISVPKNRYGPPVNERITVDLTETIEIDTTRSVA